MTRSIVVLATVFALGGCVTENSSNSWGDGWGDAVGQVATGMHESNQREEQRQRDLEYERARAYNRRNNNVPATTTTTTTTTTTAASKKPASKPSRSSASSSPITLTVEKPDQAELDRRARELKEAEESRKAYEAKVAEGKQRSLDAIAEKKAFQAEQARKRERREAFFASLPPARMCHYNVFKPEEDDKVCQEEQRQRRQAIRDYNGNAPSKTISK